MTTRESTDQRQLLEQALRQIRSLRAESAARHEPIALLGAGVRMPADIADLRDYWTALRNGVDAVTPMSEARDGRRPTGQRAGPVTRWGGLLSEVDGFDADFFGIAPAEAARMDPQQRLVLEVAWEAIEDAGVTLEWLRNTTTGVFVGVYGSDYLMMQLGDPADIDTYTAPGGAHSIVANRLSYLLDLDGPSVAVDTACSSSLTAVHLAVRALRAGDCDAALVGGVNVIVSATSTDVTGKVLPLAPGGRCRTFDAAADGIVRAEGCGMVLLTRESLARAERRVPRAVIRGTATNHDGRTNGLTAPNPRAQADLLRRAVRDARVDPAEVVYIEAHGTGTPLGDPIEFDAIRDVYGAGTRACAVGAVKTNFGHQEAAAGIAGLIKAMLVLEHGEVPPNLHLRQVNPEISLTGTRLELPQAVRPLPETERPVAAVSSFGFGGANVHVLLQAPPPLDTAPAGAAGRLILPISARSAESAESALREYTKLLAGTDAPTAAEICAAAATRRAHHLVRICLTASTVDELIAQANSVVVPPRQRHNPPLGPAFVFSGQGSQWHGMGADLYAEPAAREDLSVSEQIVRELAGWSLRDELCAPAPESRLDRTDIAQICIAAVEFALAAVWRSWGIVPSAVIGHSMGEIVAAAVGGMLTREQAFEILVRRAALTEQGARGGAMLSIAAPAAEVGRILDDRADVTIAAINGPRSTVVSGAAPGIAALADAAADRGWVVKRLPVEYAFHSAMLRPFAGELTRQTAAVEPAAAAVPLYSTVTGRRTGAHELTADHWARNLTDPVLFASAVAAASAAGITTFLEVGPHPVLGRDIAATVEDRGGDAAQAASMRREQPVSGTLLRGLADLYRSGHAIAWDAVVGEPAGRVDLPLYQWNRSRHWLPERDGVSAPARPVEPDRSPRSDPSGRVDLLTTFIRERFAQALQVPVDEVDEATVIRDFGLDSLVIVEVKNEVEAMTGTTVRLQELLDLMDHGTVRDLARVVAGAEATPVAVGDEVGSGRS
ncbi:type I polyketide synthase [Nocardia wallacei]|uniref:type I polyketide synthase n=1 Tax=Nocardia wallacei TaxID=480035 RepID=UPI0024561505|nr:beta-ketoacyl synthase N-terminal-like domain-containing protein [Nocardia wallacei]